jgi:hypothetical protein
MYLRNQHSNQSIGGGNFLPTLIPHRHQGGQGVASWQSRKKLIKKAALKT